MLGVAGAVLLGYYVLWPLFLIFLSILVAVLKVALYIVAAIFVLSAICD
jgi:hypothetical protein